MSLSMKTGWRVLKSWRCIIFLVIFQIAGNAFSDDNQSNHKNIIVYVSIPPLAFFVKAIAGNHVEVETMLSPGQSPATFEPTSKQMAKLSEASIYFKIGVPFEERLLEKVNKLLPGLKIIDVREGIVLKNMEEVLGEHDDNYHHGAKDPHVWLDPTLVISQAKIICRELISQMPNLTATFESNLKSFISSLIDLDHKLRDILGPVEGRKFMVFHPTFGYFADCYGLKQIAIEAGGSEPGARYLSELISIAGREKIRTVFVQPQFSKKSSESVARTIGANVVEIDALAFDYFNNMEKIAKRIKEGVGSGE